MAFPASPASPTWSKYGANFSVCRKNGKIYFIAGAASHVIPGTPEEPAWQAFEDAIDDSILSFTAQ